MIHLGKKRQNVRLNDALFNARIFKLFSSPQKYPSKESEPCI